jgi:hypothetical protein
MASLAALLFVVRRCERVRVRPVAAVATQAAGVSGLDPGLRG